ncbi:hypothetical protein AAES_110205 [Amazona aestiva]|uniref:Uncharacterized protein n=1 Tax=Amazona aestiva TaxID=12930 RepID=A0A0Q3PDC2_AMAAE|nr:hypothetical protein AAES_110205 [Amazona aestiva]
MNKMNMAGTPDGILFAESESLQSLRAEPITLDVHEPIPPGAALRGWFETTSRCFRQNLVREYSASQESPVSPISHTGEISSDLHPALAEMPQKAVRKV